MKISKEAELAYELWQIVKVLEDFLYESYYYDFRAITLKNEFDEDYNVEYNEKKFK